MSCRKVIALWGLILLCLGLFVLSTTSACADNGFSLQFDTGASETTSTESTDTGTDDTTAAAKRTLATKADIRDLIIAGKIQEAEASYLEWARYWQEDDAPLLIDIERAVLLQQFRDGKVVALVEMVRAGDTEALGLLRTLVLSGTTELPSAELANAIRVIGERADLNALNTLRTLLYGQDSVVVNAAIESLGNLGDKRAVPDLLKLLDQADPARSVVLAVALNKLGAGKEIVKRFTPQLRFQLPGVREKAALTLAAIGIPDGWPVIRQIAMAKTAPYYPLVLSVLGALPSDESVMFVTQGLAGTEEEQLAALKSIDLLPAPKATDALLQKLRDAGQATAIRIACIDVLAARFPAVAVRELWPLAKNEGDISSVKAAALLTMPRLGIMRQLMVRDVIRMRFDSNEEEVARAARAVMLSYALKKK